MKLDWLTRWFGHKPATNDFAVLKSGRLHIRGRVKSGPELLRAPIKGIPCVAFFYRAWYPAQGRTGMIERVLKTAEVYSPLFFLEMEGGTVRVLARKTGSLTAEQHRELQSAGYPRFQASDQPIKAGDCISIRGRVRRDDEGWLIYPKQIRLLEGEQQRPRRARGPGKKPKRRN